MLEVSNKGEIKLTRGDTAYLTVSVKNKDGEPYTVKTDDVLTLTVKGDYADEEALIEKKITGTATFHIRPEDTKDLAFGTYVYDVQITMTNGDNFTVIADKKFKITNEVG